MFNLKKTKICLRLKQQRGKFVGTKFVKGGKGQERVGESGKNRNGPRRDKDVGREQALYSSTGHKWLVVGRKAKAQTNLGRHPLAMYITPIIENYCGFFVVK